MTGRKSLLTEFKEETGPLVNDMLALKGKRSPMVEMAKDTPKDMVFSPMVQLPSLKLHTLKD